MFLNIFAVKNRCEIFDGCFGDSDTVAVRFDCKTLRKSFKLSHSECIITNIIIIPLVVMIFTTNHCDHHHDNQI
jgi:hypothetical protein